MLLIFSASIYWAYILISPYLKSEDGRVFLGRWTLILTIVSVGGYFFASYLAKGPEYFEQGIDELHTNNYRKNRIGYCSSYSYYSEKLPKETGNSTIFQVELHSDSLN